MHVEPISGAPAAVVGTADDTAERLLVVADYHAGIEAVLRHEGVEIADAADERRARLRGLIADTAPDRLVVLGDLVHAVGDPWTTERAELQALFSALSVPVIIVKGNHDSKIETVLDTVESVTVTEPTGVRVGDVGFVHGHTWPAESVLNATVVCAGHEHPLVQLEDSVGGGRTERAWVRGQIAPAPFREHGLTVGDRQPELVLFPAFNNRSGGTRVNVEAEFLSPFLPAALPDGEAYLLDGTRLGQYQTV
ncbi:MAG: putative ICC-like phosphoesterase [halophilic archaeon J07HX5]|jgi:putative phosphoesterase|nr:MAG: putative ICC-like phosphoesterase [halophilic archaeon J07HX5]